MYQLGIVLVCLHLQDSSYLLDIHWLRTRLHQKDLLAEDKWILQDKYSSILLFQRFSKYQQDILSELLILRGIFDQQRRKLSGI